MDFRVSTYKQRVRMVAYTFPGEGLGKPLSSFDFIFLPGTHLPCPSMLSFNKALRTWPRVGVALRSNTILPWIRHLVTDTATTAEAEEHSKQQTGHWTVAVVRRAVVRQCWRR